MGVSSSHERDELFSVVNIRPPGGLRTESNSSRSHHSAIVVVQSIPEIIVSQVTCYYINFN